MTIEESVQRVAARIKEVNPQAIVGMYWRMDFALELAQCSGFKDEWCDIRAISGCFSDSRGQVGWFCVHLGLIFQFWLIFGQHCAGRRTQSIG